VSGAKPTCVYVHYDTRDVVLYVGIAHNFEDRCGAHRRDSVWWKYRVRSDVEWLPDRLSAEAREAELIKSLRPAFNSRMNWEGWRRASAYILLFDPDRGSIEAHRPRTEVCCGHCEGCRKEIGCRLAVRKPTRVKDIRCPLCLSVDCLFVYGLQVGESRALHPLRVAAEPGEPVVRSLIYEGLC
jgi:predicted GIY-YIG superfamily endonuclease